MKTSFITLFITLITTLTIAQDNTCIYGDCENGFGKQVKDDLTYVGNFKDGVYSGLGEISMEGAGSFTGEWKNGLMNGMGSMNLGDGSMVVGQFKNGETHGIAIEFDTKGRVLYEGQFIEGKYEGKGYVFLYDEGIKAFVTCKGGEPIDVISQEPIDTSVTGMMQCLAGDCENGLGHYLGLLTYKYGDFSNGDLSGNGVEIFYGMSFYMGEFKDGFWSGKGQDITLGIYYNGEYYEGKKNGFGISYNRNGSRYEGEFKDNWKNGEGKYFDKNGKLRYHGQFLNERFHGTGDLYNYERNEIITELWEEGQPISVVSRRPMNETTATTAIKPISSTKKLTYKSCADAESISICLYPILNEKVQSFVSDGYSGTELHKKLANEIRTISSEYDSRVATEALILSDIIKDDDLTSGMVEQFSAEEQEVIFEHINDIQKELE